jgi:putative membrane-bound dehydrogenase-like protein
MKKFIPILVLGFSTLVSAQATPLRILYLGKEGGATSRHCHVLMREFGRDAIWFDYTDDAEVATAEWVARFDAVLLDGPAGAYPGLRGINLSKLVAPQFGESELDWSNQAFLKGIRQSLLTAVGQSRRETWEKFLAGREAEKREPNQNVANYERRPEAITFQQPFSVRGSRERTQVPVDMRLELFAGEPDIAKPIALAWDERGRCWVAETRDYPHGVQRSGEGNDSIKICEDTDGDGRADKFTIFADKLNIPTSLVFAQGGLVVSQPPRFLFLQDTNHDDRADVRWEIMTGWGIGDTHAQANNLHWGHDNWLYGCVGYSGFSGEVNGERKQFGMGTFRFKPDGSSLEFLHQFSNNSWGHSANEAGDQFGGTANGAPLFYGGIPASVAPRGLRLRSAKKINVEDKCHTITPHFRQVDVFGGYTAAAGCAFIYSANMPARLQGMAMVCEPTMKVIALMDVEPDGAGYVAKDGFNLVASSDEWMSPVFAEVGPDGAVWFADWQNFIIQHNPTPSRGRGGYDAETGVGGAHENPLRDHSRGRIYRVVWEKATKPSITSLRDVSTADLVKALSSDNPHWRLTAQRLLVEGKKVDATSALRPMVTARDAGIPAIHALWSLHGLGQLDESTHRAALLATNAIVRRNAVRALSDDDKGKALFFSAGVISDPVPITKLAAMVKVASFPTTPEIQSVAASLARNPANRADEWLQEAARLVTRKHKAEVYQEGPNLLPNPGLEIVGTNGLPQGWRRRDYGGRRSSEGAAWSVVTGEGQTHSGTNAVKCVATGEADTSLYAEVTLKPNTLYRLSGWVKGRGLRGKLSFNDHIGRTETERMTRDGDWTRVDADFNSGAVTRTTINILYVARGEGWFDDVKLCELVSPDEPAVAVSAGDIKRGENIFMKHTAACVLCHQLKGQGSTVGPALDGIATRSTAEYIRESLLEPSKVLAKGFEGTGLSPMPPMGDIFGPQELADIQAFLQTLK